MASEAPGDRGARAAAAVPKVEEEDALKEGSEEWIAATLVAVQKWVGVKRMVEGRKGELENEITMEQILDYATYAHEMMKMRFPLMTTMAPRLSVRSVIRRVLTPRS